MRWPHRRRAADERLDLEIRDHIERQVADYVSTGMSEAEARRRVRLEFGGVDQAKEHCRDVRRHQWLSELIRDVRVGFRSLARERLFAVSVITILTVGIGATVAMFSVLNTVILRDLPYARPHELAAIRTHLLLQNQPDGSSIPNWLDWRTQSKTFVDITFYLRAAASGVTFAGRESPQRGLKGVVGPGYFEVLGAAPLVGRTPSREEFDRHDRVVVLSEGLWQEQFDRSPDAIGRTLVVDGEPHTIVGVMPRTFQLPTNDTRFWQPISTSPLWDPSRLPTLNREGDVLEVIGRLAPGRTLDEARAEMGLIAARLRAHYPANKFLDVRVLPLFDYLVGDRTRRTVWLGFAAVLALLAIACANVGGLLSVRATRRRQEFAVRAALGASRARVIRQLLAESISMWAMASAGGVALAYGLLRLMLTYGPRTIPRIEQLELDAAAVAGALLGGLVVVALCGTLPSMIATRRTSAAALATRDQSSPPKPRFHDLLVAAQIAGAFVLLVGAVLFGESFIRAQRENPGYVADDLMIVRIDLPQIEYPDAAAVTAFFREARQRIAAISGVAAVGGTMDFFMRRNGDQSITIQGREVSPDAPRPRLTIEPITPGFFRASGTPIVAGREFDERDQVPGAPGVFIVSESLARHYWPGESPLGKRIVNGRQPRKNGSWDTIIGVVKDMRREGLDHSPILTAFAPATMRNMDLTIRASADVETLIPAIRRELRAMAPALPLNRMTTVRSGLAERLAGRRFESQVLVLFAAIGMVLAVAGLYALLAYQVALRTRELGIRAALGADRRSIVTMVLTHGVRLTLIGVSAGILAAALAGHVLQGLLYNTKALDASSYAAAAAGMLAIAIVAATIPARRAARVDPITALREG
jgi:putative ABC transport system permease protein